MPLQEKLGMFQGTAAAMSVGQLMIPVTLDGITQDFIFDTGAVTDVVLGYDNAQQLHARERYPKYIDMKTLDEIDGPIRISLAIGRSLAVAGASFATLSISMKMEAPSAVRGAKKPRRDLRSHWPITRNVQPRRMRKLLPKFWICSNVRISRSSYIYDVCSRTSPHAAPSNRCRGKTQSRRHS